MSEGPVEQTSTTPVLVIGGGIGGLMLGAILETANISYHILERSIVPRPFGCSIGLTGNILPLEKVSLAQPGMEFYDMRDNKSGNITTNGHKVICGYDSLLMSRPKLYEVIRSQVLADKISMGKKVLRIKEENDKVTVYCSDETTYECSILVGADGAYSAVRQSMFQDLDKKGILPESDKDGFTVGFVTMVGVANPPDPENYPDLSDTQAHFRVLLGDKNISSSVATIRNNQICWSIQVQLSKTETKEQSFRNSEWGPEALDAMMKEYENFPCAYGGTMKKMFDATPKELISKVFLEEKIFKTWHHGRTVLIGDVCHKINPGAGQGAVMSMKDAVVLANCIYNMKDNSTDSIKSAFESYYKQRHPDGEAPVQNGAVMSRMMLGHTWFQRVLRYMILSHPPYWIMDKKHEKDMAIRPQINWLPLTEAKGTGKVKPQIGRKEAAEKKASTV
ncbi:hypothetical protein BGZ46_001118 [Entomortierella lignicola]|nr:hypothetical protein BGZ46_001118 [Entomortierella lignicola]